MREHVFGELDVDKDRFISMDEFLKGTQREEFEKDEGWKVLEYVLLTIQAPKSRQQNLCLQNFKIDLDHCSSANRQHYHTYSDKRQDYIPFYHKNLDLSLKMDLDFEVYFYSAIYSRTSMAETRMAHLPCLTRIVLDSLILLETNAITADLG